MILVLSEALKDNTRIETVNMTYSLSSTQRHHDAGRVLIPLACALRGHASMKTIHLSYNQLKDATSLGVALELNGSSLTEIYLDHNNLNADTAFALARALRRNSRLSVLQLGSNNLGDDGGKKIAEALRHNTGLKTLGLARNKLKSETAKAFLETMDRYRNVSLLSLSLGGNPGIVESSERAISYLVRANRAGRYLLRNDDWKRRDKNGAGSGTNDRTNDSPCVAVGTGIIQPCVCRSSANNGGNNRGGKSDHKRSLWPHVFEGLEADMIYFFLREKPSLVNCKG